MGRYTFSRLFVYEVTNDSSRSMVQKNGAATFSRFFRLVLLPIVVCLVALPQANAQFTQQGSKLVGSDVVGAAYQGSSVSLSSDGNTAIVGGLGDDNIAGAAWIYVRFNGVWTQQGNKLVGTDAIGNASQGASVSISSDGNTAIVGGGGDNGGVGAAWVFTRSSGVWTQQGNKLVGTGATGNAGQGYVGLSSDGNTTIIGGTNDNNGTGAAWIFTRSGGVWTQQGNKLVGTGGSGSTIWQGSSVSLSSDGNTAISGGGGDNSNMGAIWVFTRSGGVWTQQGNKLVGTGTAGSQVYQGSKAFLSSDGNTVIVGGYGDNGYGGAAWIWARSGGVWTQQGNKLVGTGAVGSEILQGHSVSLSSDGNTAISGGGGDNGNAGAAWVFSRSGGLWTQQGSKLISSGSRGLGLSVSLSSDGNTLITGSSWDNNSIGASWIFITPNILLSVDSVTSMAGDTITVPIRVTFPLGKNYSASEVTLSGYKNELQFLRLDTSSTLIGGKGWSYQVNGNDSTVFTASAGANEISNNGILFNAQFKVLNGGCGFIPINIQSAVFNTGTDSVTTSGGGVYRKAVPTYGDVDKNGLIQAMDASKILKFLVGIDSLDCQSTTNADVTNNGFVSGLDATAILKYVVHLITSFPADSITMGPTSAQGFLAMTNSIPSTFGSVVEIPLNLSQGKNILSFEGKLTFNPSELSWNKVIWSTVLNSFNIEIAVDSINGIIRFAGAGSLPDGNSGKFASLFFTPKQHGTSKVSLNELRWNEEKKMTNVSSTNVVTSVERHIETILTDYSLQQNYPNPFNPSTTIRYGLPNRSTVRIVISNTLGQEVAVLTDGEKEAGYYEVEWKAIGASGIYFYRIDAVSVNDPNNRFAQVKKMVLMK